MRKKKEVGNPQIYHYLKLHQEDPSSRVFAPLSEAYRKAGLLDQAIEICREGLRTHPHFNGGRVALGRALFDQGKYDEVITEVEPVVLDAPDNLVAQKLLAESCLILGKLPQALSAYKVLLFFLPDDVEIAQLVQEIETKAYEEGALSLERDLPQLKELKLHENASEFSVQGAMDAISNDPDVRQRDWMRKVDTLQNLLLRVQRFKLVRN